VAIQLFSDGIAAFNSPHPDSPQFRVTGEFELPPDMELPSYPKARQVMALLFLRAGQLVTTDELTYELWETGIPTSRTTLHTHISQVRKGLRDDKRAKEKQLIQTAPPLGYWVNIDPRKIDILRFVDLIKGIGVSPEDDEASLRRILCDLESALSLVRGPVLKGVEHGRTLSNLIQMFDEYIRMAHTQRFMAALMLGRHQSVSGELFELYMNDLSNENVARLWMLALYRCNRRQEALTTYQKLRRVLRDEFGADPSPQVAALHVKILRGDPELAENFRLLG